MKKNRKNSTKSLLVCAVLASVLGSGFGMGVSRAEAADFTYSIDGATAVVWDGTYDLKLNEKSSTGTKLEIWGEGASSSNRIYGGYYDVDATDVSGKEVDFYSGTVDSLYGGRSRYGNATNNTVNFVGGTVSYSIYGGYTSCDTGGNASKNTVTFSGGSAMSIYGGYIHSGIAGENTINFNGGSVTNIFGGYSTASGEVSKNIVNISGGTVKYVRGGLSYGNVKANEVMITNGTIENDNEIYGGESRNNDATENTVTISGGTFGDNTKVYGGHSKITLSESSGVSEQNTVTITGGTFGDNTTVYGGHSESGVSEQNTVTITGGTFGDYPTIHGGYSEDSNVTGNNVTIENITFTGITYVRGGTAWQGTALDNILRITGCSFDNNNFIYGGDANTLAKGNKVYLTNVNYKYAIYGGYAEYNTEGNEVTISGGTIAVSDIIASLGGIYGGYSHNFGNYTAKDNTVTISDANVTGKIAGGMATNVINNKVIISGGTFGNIGVYGGIAVNELSEREIKENTVTITGGNFGSGAIICGGYFSPVGVPSHIQPILDNKVTISDGTFGSNTKIYGVYSEKDRYNATGNIVTIRGGTFGEGTVIYGSYSVSYYNLDAKTSGNKVIVSGGDLSRAEVYGHNCTGNYYKNNALQIEDTTDIKKIGGFENIDFVLPAGADNATMLTLANAVNLNGMVVSVYLNGQTPNNITLINKVENSGTYNVYTGTIGSTELTDDYTISLESGSLLLKIKEVLWYKVGTEEKKFVPNAAVQSISGVSGDVTIYRGAKENATVTPAIALNQYNDINVGEHKLIIDLNTSTKEMTANGNVSANFVEIKSGNTLTMASGKTLTATGGVTNGGTLNVGAGDLLSDVTNSGTVNLGAGTLASGSTITGGTLNITDNVTANASDIAGNTNTVAANKTLTFNGGIVAHTISGAGNVAIGDGTNEQTVSANAGNFTNEGDLTVNDDGILKLTAGSLNKAVDNSGTVELKTGSNFATDGKITGGDVTLGNDVQFTKDNLSNLTTFNANDAVFNFSANVGATPSVDKISVTGQASGTLKLGTVTVTGKDDNWKIGDTKQFSYLTGGSGHTITISNTTVGTSDGYKYIFGQGYNTAGDNTSGAKSGYMDVFKGNGVSLKVAIEGATVDTYVLLNDYTETEDLGALGGSSGRSMTIEGNGHKFMGGNYKGISVGEGKTLTLNGMDKISGWNDYAVHNDGTLNIVGQTGENKKTILDSAVTSTAGKGTTNISGNVEIGTNGSITQKDLKITGGSLTANADNLHITNSIVNNGEIKFTGGTLAKAVTGTGNLTFDGDVSTNADYIGVSGTNTITATHTLTLTDGTLAKVIGGAGNLYFNGDVTTNADNIATTGTNTVAGGKTLTFNGGTLTKKIDGAGNLKFTDNVTANADNIATEGTNTVADGKNLTFNAGILTKKVQGAGGLTFAADMTLNANNIGTTGTNTVNSGKTLTFNDGTLAQKIEGAGGLTFAADMTLNANNIGTTGTNTVNSGKTMTFNDGTLAQKIEGAGGLTFAVDMTLNANNIGTTGTNTVVDGKTLTFNGGTLAQKVQGTGNITIDGDVTTNANYIATTGTNTVADGKKLTFNGGTLAQKITGAGNLSFTGNVTTNADNIATTGTNTVESGATLAFAGGTLTKNIAGDGTAEFNNTVSVANDVDLGTNTNNVNGTLDVVEHITASNINFQSGSTLKVDGTKITDTAAITGITSATVASGAKLYVSNAEKDTAYKILDGIGIDVSSWTTDEDMGEGFRASYGLIVDTDNTTAAGTGLTEFHIQFKEDTAATGSSDIGNIIANLPAGSEAKAWIDNISASQPDMQTQGNTVNTMANIGSLANVQGGMNAMSSFTSNSIAANIGSESRPMLGIGGQGSGVRNVSANDKDSAAIETVEQGRASEVMPSQYEEQKYGKEVWASFIHSKTKIEGMKTGHLEQDSTLQYNGTVVGVDLWSGRHGFGGVALTYGDGNFHSGQMVSNVKNDADYYGISVYNRQDVGKFSFQYDAGFTYAKNDVTMSTIGAEDVTAKPKVRAYSAGIKVEEPIKVGRATEVVPFAGARYTFVKSKEYQNSLGLGYDVDNQHLVKIPVGMSLRTKYLDKSGWKFGTTLSGGYNWNLCNRSSQQRVSFGGYSDMIDFDIADRGEYFVNAAVQAEFENLLFELGYNYSKGKTTRSNKWYFNANLGF